jgi:CheY-like chemotaxis protein
MAHILVVDDDPDGRQLIGIYLRRLGHTVDDARDGEIAIRKLLDDRPDALVLDVRMPRIDGIGLLEIMRSSSRWQTLPVVLLTALATPQQLARAGDMGVKHVFHKTKFQLADLGAAMEKLVGRPHKVAPWGPFLPVRRTVQTA